MLFAVLLACAGHVPPESQPALQDYQPQVQLALDFTGQLASLQMDASAAKDDVNGCVGWAVVKAVGPVAAAILPQASAKEFTSIPAISVNTEVCGVHAAKPVSDKVMGYVGLGFNSAELVLSAWNDPAKCRERVAVTASLRQAHAIVPQLLSSIDQGTWIIEVPAQPVDFSACSE